MDTLISGNLFNIRTGDKLQLITDGQLLVWTVSEGRNGYSLIRIGEDGLTITHPSIRKIEHTDVFVEMIRMAANGEPRKPVRPPKTGEQLRDKGHQLVLLNNKHWSGWFSEVAGKMLETQSEITAEEVVKRIGLPEGSRNAIGGAMRKFALANKLVVVRYQKSKKASRHAAVTAVWGRAS